ncbi:carbamoyltransferase HypF [Hydrogenimonas sp.]
MRWRCRITGIVQGVGFRPTLYRYAVEAGVTGFVGNDAEGVIVEIEGEEAALRRLIERLREAPPPLARIDAIAIETIPLKGESAFTIAASSHDTAKQAAVSPDVSLCEACLKEMRDPENRRYRYPFINCTDCGPRYTIVRTVPYDRPNTSMAKFTMCEACEAEYHDPMDRRYHAQPIACFDCGTQLSLMDSEGRALEGDAIEEAAKLLVEGKIVAVKGLGGFHLMCDATSEEAVARLRERKGRPDKPFAVMVKDMRTARRLARVQEREAALLQSKERPIVLLKKSGTTELAEGVAPGIDRIGLMLPYTPLHYLLFDHIARPLVATSANLSDEPIIKESGALIEKLGHVADAVLDHDRDILNACDDSVAQVVGDRVQWIRVARGVAPMTLPIASQEAILAVGAQQKNTIALSLQDAVILSPHVGDLGSLEAMAFFEETVATFGRLYDFRPQRVVCDLHPGYDTTRWALALAKKEGLKSTAVQHHHAHALAVMAEHGVHEEILAFVWDGTGYGEDGTVWGGEVLLCDAAGYRRVGHLRPFRLLGGERAVREPRRSALALLYEIFVEAVEELSLPTLDAFTPAEKGLLFQAWRKGMGSPLTTSMGRLFDAMASLLGIVHRVSYEGQSGMMLETLAAQEKAAQWLDGFALQESETGWVCDWEPVVRAIVGGKVGSPARFFIESLAEMVARLAARYPDRRIALCGGVFLNRTLMEACLRRLPAERLLLPERLPPGDGAIALGQLWYALHEKD